MPELDPFEARFAAAYRRYLDEARTTVDAAAIAHDAARARPRRRFTLGTSRGLQVPRLAWMLLMAGALLAAAALGLVVGSRLLGTPPLLRGATLVPTGIDVLTPATGSYSRMVADGQGILWAREDDGRLVRYDPTSGSVRTWTIADDATFATATDIAPSTGPGVWLIEPRALRRFDGDRFAVTIDTPAEVILAAEAADGSVWAATSDGAVLHWAGSTWARLETGHSNSQARINALAVDGAGRPWIGWHLQSGPPSGGGVAVHDGTAWTEFGPADVALLGGAVWTIEPLPDGTVWVATSAGVARFDGRTWTDATGPAGGYRPTVSVASAPDGTIWTAAGSDSDGTVSVGRYAGGSWTFQGPAEGLPDANQSGYVTAWIAPTPAGTYVGTGAGIYRLTGSRWDRVWPPVAPVIDPGAVVALSRDELWAVGTGGLWHYRSGTWVMDGPDPDLATDNTSHLALAPDGTLWAADATSVAYREGGTWVVADTHGASAITFTRDGTPVLASGFGMSTLERDGVWVRRQMPLVPIDGTVSSLAVDGRGTLWAGVAGGWVAGGLARYEDQAWTPVREIDGAKVYGASVLGTDPAGDVWVQVSLTATSSNADYEQRLARFDGTSWTSMAVPCTWARCVVVAPDGAAWMGSSPGGSPGLTRYDGRGFTGISSVPPVPWLAPVAVARDGTVFGSLAGAIVRLPVTSGR